MKSAIGRYKGKWYRQVEGIPTGRSISVQLANITVYHVLFQCLYSSNILLKSLHFISGSLMMEQVYSKVLHVNLKHGINLSSN